MHLKNHLLKLFWQSDFILPKANVIGHTNVRSIVSRKEPEPCSLCQSDRSGMIWCDLLCIGTQILGIVVLKTCS